MPASRFDLYHMQDAKNNFDAIRPAPVCNETNQLMGQCHNIHISTNCYYGYHDAKNSHHVSDETDCEMVEVPKPHNYSPQNNARKRSADDDNHPACKRHRQEVQRKKNSEPETTENTKLDTNSEDYMESLYWNIHGGSIFHVLQCL